MTRQHAPLSSGELVTWLTQVSHMIDRDLREPVRSEAVRPLRDERAGTATLGVPVLAQLALLADCLRVAHLAIGADGEREPGAVARVADLVRVAATKYYTALPAYEMFDERPASAGDVARFLGVHRDDAGPFGLAHPSEWPGLALARVVERAARNASPLRAHERMLGRIMDAVFQERATAAERAARRRLRELFEEPAAAGAAGVDPRALAFCRSDGPEVFSSIAHGSHVHERDPFDVETIHAEARDVFLVQVERATTPEHVQHGHGRTLLVLGDSGAGKTHLLRALRTLVHERGLGYVGYVQTTTDADDFARYVLRGLIDSLERPYDAPSRLESGLMYLSDGFVQGRAAVPADELDRLRTAELAPDELEHLVGRLVDRIVRSEGLAGLETDLVQVLLLLQRRDPALQRRVVRFLRCEPLNGYDRQLLGGLNARAKSEDPQRTIVQLAKIMHELQLAALVLLVDQVEETIPDGRNVARLQQALDTLRAIADAVPSAVVVISCLEDVYDAARPRLSRALLDRLEHDPPPVRLTSQRQPAEIEEMLIRRLDHLYAAFDVAWRDDDPLFPFTPAQLEAVSRMRTRDCLASFREYHGACIAARAIVAPVVRGASAATAATAAAGVTVMAAIHLDKEWARVQAEIRDLPEAEPEIVGLVASALRGAALELGLELTVRQDAAGRLAMAGRHVKPSLLALVNRGPQGGHLGAQINELRKLAKQAKAVPIALRTSDFSFQPKTKISQQLGELAADGGLAVVLPEQQLRVAAAAHLLEERAPPGLAAWRRESRPLAELAFVREIFEHLRIHASAEPEPAPEPAATAAAASPHPPPVAPPPRQQAQASTPAPVRLLPRKPSGTPAAPAQADSTPAAPTPADSTPAAPMPAAPALANSTPATPPAPASPAPAPAPLDPHTIRLGVVDSMRADPILLPLEQLKTHMAFLGSTGSGKTTAALCVVEQLLERGISVLLVDRKGDLARYVSDAWWHDPTAPPQGRERKAALRARIDVALYTPGNPQGRPLRLPLVPALDDAAPHDREQLARFAAGGLATMMGYGSSAAHKAKASILQCAINLHAAERDVSLDMLLDTISRPDPELLHTVGALQRHFAGLTEDLQTLSIQRGSLVSGQGDALDVEQLLPPLGAGRPRLSVINTAALTEVPVLQFWISRLLVELGRLGRRRPSPALQAAAFFDEADAYVPATSSPPTKEPMFDLLRRSRSTGIGVLLATQNPGDFDYKARDNITTWLLGKVTQDRAIDKMRNLIASYPDVGPRLASQRTGSFFLLTGATKRELKADRSLMETAQLSEAEVAELARATRSPAEAPDRREPQLGL